MLQQMGSLKQLIGAAHYPIFENNGNDVDRQALLVLLFADNFLWTKDSYCQDAGRMFFLCYNA
jgi:hypothetical protein